MRFYFLFIFAYSVCSPLKNRLEYELLLSISTGMLIKLRTFRLAMA